MKFKENLVFVDVETSGMSPDNDRVIEFAAIRVENGDITKEYTKLLNPRVKIPWYITNVTGIKEKDLEGAPEFSEIFEEVDELLKDAVFIAHNVDFDYNFIKNEYKRVNSSFDKVRLCTVNLSRRLYPIHRRHNLDSLLSRHNIKIENRHRALDDAYALWEFYQIVNREFPDNHLFDVIESIKKHPKKSLVDPKQSTLF